MPGYGWVIGFHAAPGNDEWDIYPDTPTDDILDQLMDREGRLAFAGHTHQSMDRDLGAWRMVNVGSVGFPYDDRHACYVLVTFDGGSAHVEFRRVEYDVESVIADMQANVAGAGDGIRLLRDPDSGKPRHVQVTRSS